MLHIYDIVLRFMPPELTGDSAAVFIGVGSVVAVSFLIFLFYKIVRIFI